jgi:DNA ligase (NAD+)
LAEYRSAVERVRSAATAYYGGSDLAMDDAAYDGLLARVVATEAVQPGRRVVGSPIGVVGAGGGVVGDVEHGTPMLSLDNVFGEEPLRRPPGRRAWPEPWPGAGRCGTASLEGIGLPGGRLGRP